LERVEGGEETVITPDGKPVVRLVPDQDECDRSKAEAAAERIRVRERNLKAGEVHWEALRADRDAGRP